LEAANRHRVRVRATVRTPQHSGRGRLSNQSFRGNSAFQEAESASVRLSQNQYVMAGSAACFSAILIALWPITSLTILHLLGFGLFGLSILQRLIFSATPRKPRSVVLLPDHALPRYTVLLPLYREAQMVPGLINALRRLDYPDHRSEWLFLVENSDPETLEALNRANLPSHAKILVVPPGTPTTKPRACNFGLARATGQLIVIFDAEDLPHPQQLREAASQFSVSDPRLACLQAPLRILPSKSLLGRQFAVEYAILFELVLPAMTRIGLAVPLGGTSNHFKTEVLRAIGGWDRFNVTEDADVGFRLATEGYSTATLTCPTLEAPPTRMSQWLPQRARWLKGFIQTLAVHLRTPGGLRPLTALSLFSTIGLTVISALVHAPLAVWLLVNLSLALAGVMDWPQSQDLGLLLVGWVSHALAARQSWHLMDHRITFADVWTLMLAPLYWPLLSVAALRAFWQFIFHPHRWDKTEHQPLLMLQPD